MASPTMLSRESSESRSSVDAAPSLAAGGNATRVTLAMGLGTIGGSTANAEPAAEPWTRQARFPPYAHVVSYLLLDHPFSLIFTLHTASRLSSRGCFYDSSWPCHALRFTRGQAVGS